MGRFPKGARAWTWTGAAARCAAGCAVLMCAWLPGPARAEGPPVKAPALRGGEWINTPPLTADSLAGRVVLVEFWALQCINCHRTLPAMKKLHALYRDSGVVIVGIHTPELPAEHGRKAVEKAVADQGIPYPVLVDDRMANWDAFENRYWPALYVIDRKGMIRDVEAGELHEGTLEWRSLVTLINQLRREKG
jgi:thiol-disulfide isomerase/thioredoxin